LLISKRSLLSIFSFHLSLFESGCKGTAFF